MAGLAGLPYFLQYQQQAQDQALQRQYAQIQLAQFQQAQQDRQRQQAALAAAGNALPMLLGQQPQQPMQMPAPPQAPNPGQPSAPAQPSTAGAVPGQIPPLPLGMPSGMGAATGAPGKPPLPPFQPMPTAGSPAQAAPAQIPSPPAFPAAPQQAGGPLTLDNAIKVLKDQGLSGADLMAGLQQLTPILDSQAKAQAAQIQMRFEQEMKLQAVQDRHAALEERIREANQRSEDRALDRADRAQARAESNALRAESIALRKQTIALANGDDAKFSPEDLKFLAEQARAGDTSVYQNLGRGAQGAKNIIALRREVMRQEREVGGTGADIAAANAGFQGEKAAARTGATRAANIGMAVAEAQKTFPLVRQASAALPRTQFVPANRAIQAAQSNTGDPRVVALGTALNTSINAYARAISPTGTPTVADKEHARELLSTASTPEQLDAVLTMMEKEMAAARQAPTEVQAQQKARISGRGEGAPAVGTIEGGYRFKGGDPSKQSNWEKM
ncbi:hypothetical protein WT12_14775 [Burkholderia territorii]|uniref:hypothetical protein n=1 Tax=Burkholderia territorii TaxID=1503055 RepID=UPI00075911B6|nr:hypothetical protein [Burkholderia territorii]KVN46847.1 hypothetical protein WT12_14775 [Burkholderia territorii]